MNPLQVHSNVSDAEQGALAGPSSFSSPADSPHGSFRHAFLSHRETSVVRPTPLLIAPSTICPEPETTVQPSASLQRTGAAALACAATFSSRHFRGPKTAVFKEVGGVQVPIRLVFTTLLCFFTVLPAVLLWWTSWKLGTDGLDAMQKMGENSVEGVVSELRGSVVHLLQGSLFDFFSAAESELDEMVFRLESDDTLLSDGYDYRVIRRHDLASLFAIRANPWMSMIQLLVNVNVTFDAVNKSTSFVQSYTYARLRVNNVGGNVETFYAVRNQFNLWRNDSTLSASVVDPQTGVEALFSSYSYGRPAMGTFMALRFERQCFWDTDLQFNVNTFIPQIPVRCFLPNVGRTALFFPVINTNVYTISALLASLVNPDERLFLCFENQRGTLIGASHGKFFSHSDLDLESRLPSDVMVAFTELKSYSPLNSTDAVILASGQWVLRRYSGWDMVPEFDELVTLNGVNFWFESARLVTKYGLKLHLCLLINRNSKLGSFDQLKASTVHRVSTSNVEMIVVLVLVVAVALALALGISLVISSALRRLASGMDRIAMLRFDPNAALDPSGDIEKRQSRFSEVRNCESSFTALERGIRAFIKYVPRDVVRMMLSGEMESENSMTSKILTVLFMDIVGFTPLCERIPTDRLVVVTTHYFQEMCACIVATGGTLDKFIGDCIMAMWNAPRPNQEHALAACSASLEMQARLMSLNRLWENEGLPQLKFRCGINTAKVLVGNFGCDFRISYTCLGDGVNLASRLESANKSFGTVVLVSDATRQHVATEFLFRSLGRITVAGKEEVVSVFEPICRTSSGFNRSGRTLSQPLNFSVSIPSSPVSARLIRSVISVEAAKLEGSSNEGHSSEVDGIEARPSTEDKPVLFHWELLSFSTVHKLALAFEKGIPEFVEGNFTEALRWFQEAHDMVPSDQASTLFIEQCKRASERPCYSSPCPIMVQQNGVLRFDQKN